MSSLAKFLDLVPSARWTHPPAVWNDVMRQALSDGLIKVGWGGVIILTADGRRMRAGSIGQEREK